MEVKKKRGRPRLEQPVYPREHGEIDDASDAAYRTLMSQNQLKNEAVASILASCAAEGLAMARRIRLLDKDGKATPDDRRAAAAHLQVARRSAQDMGTELKDDVDQEW